MPKKLRRQANYKVIKNIPEHNIVSCEGKIRYDSKDQAKKAAKQVNKKIGKTELFQYRCPLCEYYHIGHNWDKIKLIEQEQRNSIVV